MILDTNALSALLDKDSALLEVIRESRELALPVIVLGEFRFGIGVSRRRDQYEAWLRRDLSLFRVLSVVEETSVYYAANRSELKAALRFLRMTLGLPRWLESIECRSLAGTRILIELEISSGSVGASLYPPRSSCH